MRIKRILCFLLALLLLSALFTGCRQDQTDSVPKKNIEDYRNAKVGVATGTYPATIVKNIFPIATIQEYSTISELTMAVSQGKVDIAPVDASVYTCMLWDGISISRLEQPVESLDYGIVFKKDENTELREQMNTFLAKIRENGIYDELHTKWFSNIEPTEFKDPAILTGTNGKLKVATTSDIKPFSYINDGRLVGYDIDIMVLFAEEYGYTLDISTIPFSALLADVSDDRYDIGISGLTITDERKESVDFSDVYHKEDVVLIVKGNGGLTEFQNANLGVVTGSLYGGYSKELFPNAKISEFNNFADVLVALSQGKVDATMLDRPNFNSVRRTNDKLSCVTVPQYSVDIGFGFQKNEGGYTLQTQMNSLLSELRADGSLDTMIDKWYGEEEPSESIPLDNLSVNSKKLKVAIDTTRKPFVYLYENKPVGFEIEVLYKFCEKYSYDVEISDVSFASGISGLAGEKYDLVCGGLYMTQERKESVNFSDPYMSADVVMATYDKSDIENFFSSVGESFQKTFIRESRWKLILEGIVTTLIISACSVLGGTILGFLLYLATRSSWRICAGIVRILAKVYSKIIAGTPTLVVLMILFYVVFGRTDINGIAVAIVGFSLTFGSFVYNQLILTVSSVDFGQTEAAYALGYSRNRTFFRIILPQAMKMFLPVYSSEIVGLIKATSVVGYIAVNDLTKMGDIIRGNTYEAFFPLIAVAVIYFIITWGTTALLGLLARNIEPKRRKKKNILKGVER